MISDFKNDGPWLTQVYYKQIGQHITALPTIMLQQLPSLKAEQNTLHPSQSQIGPITSKQKLTLIRSNDKNMITKVQAQEIQNSTVFSARGGQQQMQKSTNKNETTANLGGQNEEVDGTQINDILKANRISSIEGHDNKVDTQSGENAEKGLVQKEAIVEKSVDSKDKQAVPLERNIFAYKRFKSVQKPGFIAERNDVSIEQKVFKNGSAHLNTKNESQLPLSSLGKIMKQPKLSRNSKHISLPKLVFPKKQSFQQIKIKHQRASSEVTVSKNLSEKNLDESEVVIGIKEKRKDELNKVRDSLALLNKKMQKIRDENNVHLETTVRALERNKDMTNRSAKVRTIMDISK